MPLATALREIVTRIGCPIVLDFSAVCRTLQGLVAAPPTAAGQVAEPAADAPDANDVEPDKTPEDGGANVEKPTKRNPTGKQREKKSNREKKKTRRKAKGANAAFAFDDDAAEEEWRLLHEDEDTGDKLATPKYLLLQILKGDTIVRIGSLFYPCETSAKQSETQET